VVCRVLGLAEVFSGAHIESSQCYAAFMDYMYWNIIAFIHDVQMSAVNRLGLNRLWNFPSRVVDW